MRINPWFFKIEKWLPSDWPELSHAAMRDAVTDLVPQGGDADGPRTIVETHDLHGRSNPDLLRIACCVFWHVYCGSGLFEPEELDALRAAWRPTYEPDEAPDWIRA